ncbi:MAG: hypothetical protein JWO06_3617 [Bacteroidota bacterium]|nr:hypothetical protein [Bacteroidota bacterium]
MTFRADAVPAFITAFESRKALIASFEGCAGVQLLRDLNNPNSFFTYSKWVNEDALEVYRNSILFNSTWEEVKKLFGDKPEAWSVNEFIS